jgi:hypothetical protein
VDMRRLRVQSIEPSVGRLFKATAGNRYSAAAKPAPAAALATVYLPVEKHFHCSFVFLIDQSISVMDG